MPQESALKVKHIYSNFSAGKPKLLVQVSNVLRLKHYSKRTEEAYINWIKRFIIFHNKKHPLELGEKEINQYLTHLAIKENVSASTQNLALCAIIFLYKQVLKKDIGEVELTRAKKAKKLPTVFSRKEVKAIMDLLTGVNWIMAYLLYGSGLRLMECVRIRLKDIDFANNRIIIRDGKGKKDRVTILPEILKETLERHIVKVEKLHKKDLEIGYGTVFLPYALDKKYPNANKELRWQYLFPASQISLDKRTGIRRRHHTDEFASFFHLQLFQQSLFFCLAFRRICILHILNLCRTSQSSILSPVDLAVLFFLFSL